MIFIYTCSQDTSTDLLIPHFASTPVFRFNIDRRKDYCWDFSCQGFRMSNLKTAESIDSAALTSFYLRKPLYAEPIDIPSQGCLENWCREEIGELFRDFQRECEARNLTTLVHSRNGHLGKIRQMRIAANYFKIASWHVFYGILPDELTRGKWVAKALTGIPVGQGKMLFVKEVDPTKLDLSYPWFLQEKIDGEDEVTVVYVNGKLFAYRYPRLAIETTEDVRLATHQNPSDWQSTELSAAEESAIRGFMAETGYSFGRFDFIRKDGELWFLELNPNGQWAWLDEKNEHGLISAIAEAIITEDLRHQRAESARRPFPPVQP